MKFWAYIHKDGTVFTKRYFDENDIIEAQDSDFVRCVLMPIEAESIAEAAKIFRDIIDGLAKTNMDFSKRFAK